MSEEHSGVAKEKNIEIVRSYDPEGGKIEDVVKAILLECLQAPCNTRSQPSLLWDERRSNK